MHPRSDPSIGQRRATVGEHSNQPLLGKTGGAWQMVGQEIFINETGF